MVASVARSEGSPRLNIGQVLDRLRTDFEDISIPKIRFLESEGLVKPERTPAGYRKFSEDDITRLRYILQMQRDHYLPLKVIGEHLDAIDRGLEPPAPEPVVPTVPRVAIGADGLPSPESFRRTDRLRMSRKELVKVTEAVGVAHPSLVTVDDIDILNGHSGSRSLRDVYGYEAGWGELGAGLREEITTLMMPTGKQAETTSMEQGEGEKEEQDRLH